MQLYKRVVPVLTSTYNTVFMCSSYDRGSTYNVFVGKKQLIAGMDKALVGMCVNQRSLVKIPPQLAYGKQGYGVYSTSCLIGTVLAECPESGRTEYKTLSNTCVHSSGESL